MTQPMEQDLANAVDEETRDELLDAMKESRRSDTKYGDQMESDD